MKPSKIPLILAAIPIALADFWLIYQRRFVQLGRIEFALYGTSIVANAPQWTCENDAFTHIIIPDQRNASGSNYGVEFEPWNSVAGPLWHDPLVDLKINMDPGVLGYQTIANDKGFAMMNTKDGISAQCYLNRTFVIDLDCWFAHPDPNVEQFHVNINGSSMFFYESDVKVDADTDNRDGSLRDRDSGMLPIGIPVIPTIIPCSDCD